MNGTVFYGYVRDELFRTNSEGLDVVYEFIKENQIKIIDRLKEKGLYQVYDKTEE